jgi:hypothetical protein
MDFTRPSRESSPKRRSSSKRSREMTSKAMRMPIAMGRSKPAPSFFTSAGTRLTVFNHKDQEYGTGGIAVPR